MKQEEILYLVVAFFLGYFLNNMMKDNVEGFGCVPLAHAVGDRRDWDIAQVCKNKCIEIPSEGRCVLSQSLTNDLIAQSNKAKSEYGAEARQEVLKNYKLLAATCLDQCTPDGH